MDLQPTLVGERTILRPTVPEDWAPMFAVASDPLIWEVHPAHDRWQEPVFRRYFQDALDSGGGLTICDRTSGAVIGASRYSCARVPPGTVEIGWTFLSRAYWGGATNAEIKRLMLDHAFSFFPAAYFLVGEGNVRSRKAMEKIGGVLRDGVHEYAMAGALSRHVVYEIRRP